MQPNFYVVSCATEHNFDPISLLSLALSLQGCPDPSFLEGTCWNFWSKVASIRHFLVRVWQLCSPSTPPSLVSSPSPPQCCGRAERQAHTQAELDMELGIVWQLLLHVDEDLVVRQLKDLKWAPWASRPQPSWCLRRGAECDGEVLDAVRSVL